MKIFEGVSPEEKKKRIVAIVLGALALLSLIYTFSGIFVGGKRTTINVTVSPTPTATPTETQNAAIQTLNRDQIYDQWLTMPVVYNPSTFFAPDAGRNVFAFYEPPAPTPYVPIPVSQPSPTEMPTPPTPTPTPPQTLIVSFITPQSVYAGSKGFRLEINGDKFTPDTFIYFNGVQLPTNFVSPQKLTADIPANLIAGEGMRQIEVRTSDGKFFAYPVQLNVQAAPRPQFQYIGMIARRSFNNDTAYFQESGKPTPFGARLNDVVAGRFRLVSISANETIFEDTSLGFRHRIPLFRPSAGQSSNPGDTRNNQINNGGFPEGFNIQPNTQFPQVNPVPNPTGIPQGIPRSIPPPQKKIEEDEDDEDGNP